MGIAVLSAAIFVGCALLAGAWFFSAGIAVYVFFERAYGQRLIVERQKAYEAGRQAEIARRAKEIRDLELPNNKYEEEEAKTYAEGLAGLYPADPELKKAIEQSQKLKEIVGGP